jgi:hypothetical protein
MIAATRRAAAQSDADDAPLLVTTTADSGRGSLRDAIVSANASKRARTIRFDAKRGPFSSPQKIVLASELPVLRGSVTIDGYLEDQLWKPSGVTVSGAGSRRVLRVAPGAMVKVMFLTIADGSAEVGAGILNEGTLVVKGVTFKGNAATRAGGAVASLAGSLSLINSTFTENQAGETGGAVAHLGGSATVTNCTIARNRARRGGGVHARVPILVRNTILANNGDGRDCVAEGGLDARSTHDLIMSNEGCGEPLVAADPRLEPLAAYNGPAETMPLGGGSPATNMGDNAAAVDEDGQPLVWDQRGNGDPRFVAGFTDIGAFEVQAFPTLEVNTPEDRALRGCSGIAASDCSLRGAIELANASKQPATITFKGSALGPSSTITLASPLPDAKVDLTLDGRGAGAVVVRGPADVLRASGGRQLRLQAVRFEPLR